MTSTKATLLNSDWSAQLTGGNPVVPGTDTYEWTVLFQGAMLDTKSGLYTMGYRQYSTSLGRWIEQDPAGYVDAANLYEALRSSPDRYSDPAGLWVVQVGFTGIVQLPGGFVNPGLGGGFGIAVGYGSSGFSLGVYANGGAGGGLGGGLAGGLGIGVTPTAGTVDDLSGFGVTTDLNLADAGASVSISGAGVGLAPSGGAKVSGSGKLEAGSHIGILTRPDYTFTYQLVSPGAFGRFINSWINQSVQRDCDRIKQQNGGDSDSLLHANDPAFYDNAGGLDFYDDTNFWRSIP